MTDAAATLGKGMPNDRPEEPGWVTLSGSLIRRIPRGRYPLMNWLCRRPQAPFVSRVRATRTPLRFVCDLRDGIAREVCFMGHYEPQETVLLRSLLGPGMTFVDVGANWGYFTLVGAELVGSGGRVLAFEPHPQIFALLAENVERNQLTWATPLRMAISDQAGEVELESFAGDSVNWGVSRISMGSAPGKTTYRVPSGTLEEQLAVVGIGEVDLLKIDIEGAEAFVVPTLSASLAAGRFKRILLEVHPVALGEMGIPPEDVVRAIFEQGYTAWRIDHSSDTFRRASYTLPADAREFLQPHASMEVRDSWPHLLFLAPGVQPSW